MEKQIGLKFGNEEEFMKCLEILENERPDISFDLPGMQSVIIPEGEEVYFRDKLHYEIVGVLSAGDLSQEELDEVRKESKIINKEQKIRRIEELKKKK